MPLLTNATKRQMQSFAAALYEPESSRIPGSFTTKNINDSSTSA
jgi:hypothetical protein